MKVLRTAAMVVGAIATVAQFIPGPWQPFAAVVSKVSMAAVAALSVAEQLTAKPPRATSTGSPDQFSADPQGYVPYVIGRTATRGNIVFRRAWDTSDKGDNDRQAFVAVLSLGPIQGIESFTSDKEAVTFDGAGQAVGKYSSWMWQTRQLGACPEAAALGFGAAAGAPPGWGSDRKLSGLAAATWTLRYDTKAEHYQNGVPAPRWVLLGAKAYDPRLDSTYPGGSGPQRAADESTWAYSTNPFLHGLTWCLGRHQNGQRVMGVGAPLAGIDVAAFVEGANVADLNGWKVAGVIYSGDDRWDTLKKILQAGMGEPMKLGAMISCFVNSPKVVLATVTVADIVGDLVVPGTQTIRTRANGIVPRYWQEQNDWQFLPGTAVRVAAHEADDGGRRTKTVDYAFIPSDGALPGGGDKQIATACRYDIENGREFGPISLPLRIRWLGYKPGDCIALTHPEASLDNQPILLLNREFEPSTGVVTFTARSETNAKHAFALGQTADAPPTPGVSGPALIPVPGPSAWAITATAIAFEGSTIPAIVITGAVDSPVAEAIVFEYRPYVSGQDANAGWIGATMLPPTATQAVINIVAAGAQYEAAVSYQRGGVKGSRTILGPVAAGQLVIDYGMIGGPTRPDDNATNSADPDSPFGGGTVRDVLLHFDDVDGLIAQLQAADETLTAQIADISIDLSEAPNLVQDVDTWFIQNGPAFQRGVWGPVITGGWTGAPTGGEDFIAWSPQFVCPPPGAPITLSCDLGCFSSSAASYVCAAIQFIDPGGTTVIGYSDRTPKQMASTDFAEGRDRFTVSGVVPAGAGKAIVVLIGGRDGTASMSFTGIRRVKVERNDHSTAYNETATTSVVAGVARDSATKLAGAYWTVNASVPGASARISAVATTSNGTTTSAVEIAARQFTIDTGFGVQPVFGVIGGFVQILGTLRTAGSGGRKETSANVDKIYDASNRLRVQIGDLSA